MNVKCEPPSISGGRFLCVRADNYACGIGEFKKGLTLAAVSSNGISPARNRFVPLEPGKQCDALGSTFLTMRLA